MADALGDFAGRSRRGATPDRGAPRAGCGNRASFWLGGFKSDMKGTKAEALDRWAAEHGRACLRFDYSGHGESERRLRRRHHRPLAGGKPRGVRRVRRRARRS